MIISPGFGVPPTRSSVKLALAKPDVAFGRRGNRGPSNPAVIWEAINRTQLPMELRRPLSDQIIKFQQEIEFLIRDNKVSIENRLLEIAGKLDAALLEEPWNK